MRTDPTRSGLRFFELRAGLATGVARPRWDRRRTAVAAAGIVSFVNLYAPQSLLPTFAQVFGTDAAHASLTLTATLLAVACVAPFVGGLSDRFFLSG